MTFRTGPKVGRTIYLHDTDDPDGELVGTLDTRTLAAFAVDAMNTELARRDLHAATLLEQIDATVEVDATPPPRPAEPARRPGHRWDDLVRMLLAGILRLIAFGLLIAAASARPAVRWDLALYAAALLVWAIPFERSTRR